MTRKISPRVLLIAVASAILIGGCNGELSQNSAPVDLVISTTAQPIQRFDLAGGTGCGLGATIVQVQIQSIVKNPAGTNTAFLDVRLKHYHVSYTRTDGGTQVPLPYDRTMDFLITAGTPSSDVIFHITDFQQIFSQAPFAALLPQNGGRDPQTGSNVVKMNITLTIFGETLAGDNVAASTSFPLDVCYNCGGCQP